MTTHYEARWVSPVTGKHLMTDGGWFDTRAQAIAWAKGLCRRRERDGISKGTLYELPDDKVVMTMGSG